MCIKGIGLINSMYCTLIDVQSKGGTKKEAVRWLERMNKHGMKPDGDCCARVQEGRGVPKGEGVFQRSGPPEGLRVGKEQLK